MRLKPFSAYALLLPPSVISRLQAIAALLSVASKHQFDLEGSQDLEAKRQRVETLGKSIEREKGERDDAQVDEAAARANVDKYEQLLKENEDSEKAQKGVEKLVALKMRLALLLLLGETAFLNSSAIINTALLSID